MSAEKSLEAIRTEYSLQRLNEFFAYVLEEGTTPDDFFERVTKQTKRRGILDDRWCEALYAPVFRRIAEKLQNRLPFRSAYDAKHAINLLLTPKEKMIVDLLINYGLKSPERASLCERSFFQMLADASLSVRKLPSNAKKLYNGHVVSPKDVPAEEKRVKTIDGEGRTRRGLPIYVFHKHSNNQGGGQESDGTLEPSEAIRQAELAAEDMEGFFVFVFSGSTFTEKKMADFAAIASSPRIEIVGLDESVKVIRKIEQQN